MAKKKKLKYTPDPKKPCRNCLIGNDATCAHIKCPRWRLWWVRRWDYARELVRPYIEKEDA
jgi:hypothetical protein